MCIKQHRFGAEMIIKQARGFGQMYRYRTGREQTVEEEPECSPDGSSPSV
jgi:hypothetical protein